MLLRHCMGKCNNRLLLECGRAVEVSVKNCPHGITALCPLSQGLPQNAGSVMGVARR